MTTPSMTRKQAQDILGVSQAATTEEIKWAYRHIVKTYHPDALVHLKLSEAEVLRMNDKIRAINVAYGLLSDTSVPSADPTDRLWQAISEAQAGYVQTALAAAGALPRGIAAVQATSMAMAVVMCPWLTLNPFFTATQNILARFAAADALDAPPTEVTPQEAEHSGRCLPAPAKHTGARS